MRAAGVVSYVNYTTAQVPSIDDKDSGGDCPITRFTEQEIVRAYVAEREHNSFLMFPSVLVTVAWRDTRDVTTRLRAWVSEKFAGEPDFPSRRNRDPRWRPVVDLHRVASRHDHRQIIIQLESRGQPAEHMRESCYRAVRKTRVARNTRSCYAKIRTVADLARHVNVTFYNPLINHDFDQRWCLQNSLYFFALLRKQHFLMILWAFYESRRINVRKGWASIFF